MGGAQLQSHTEKADAINNPSVPVLPTSCAYSSSSAAQTPQAPGTDYCVLVFDSGIIGQGYVQEIVMKRIHK